MVTVHGFTFSILPFTFARMHRFFANIFLVLIAFHASAQMVNIESQRMQSDTTGWMGSLGTSFSIVKNVQQIITIDANAHVQYKTKKDLYLFIASYDLLKAENTDLTNNMYYHLRYNRKLNKWLRWEIFTQLQQNTVTGIRYRALYGTGPRFKIHDSKHLHLYTGTAAMYEREEENTKPSVEHRDIRGSNYVTFTWLPNGMVSLISTFYYQPLFKKFADYRFLNQTSFTVKATKHLSIVTGINYLFDAYPAAGTPREYYEITNGIVYQF